MVTGIINTYAGLPSLLGGYDGDGGPATAATLSIPTGLAVSSNYGVMLADRDNKVVRRVSNDTVAGHKQRRTGNVIFRMSDAAELQHAAVS